MTINDALNKLTVMLGLNSQVVATEAVETNDETVEVTLAEATLVSGAVVTVEGEFEVGKALFVVTEEGNIQAPEGIHETTEGLIITVDAEGMIVSIEEKAPEAPAEPAAPAAVEAGVSDEALSKIVDVIKPALEEISSLKAELEALQANFSAFKNEPAGKKITNNLSEYKSSTEAFTDQRFEQLKKIRSGKTIK